MECIFPLDFLSFGFWHSEMEPDPEDLFGLGLGNALPDDDVESIPSFAPSSVGFTDDVPVCRDQYDRALFSAAVSNAQSSELKLPWEQGIFGVICGDKPLELHSEPLIFRFILFHLRRLQGQVNWWVSCLRERSAALICLFMRQWFKP